MGLASEITDHAVKAAPPLAVASATVMGVSLQEWVFIVTIVYTLLQIAFLVVPRVRKFLKDRTNGG